MRKVKNNWGGKFRFLFSISMSLMVISMFGILTVKAEETSPNHIVDFSRKGTISITLFDSFENNKVEGADVTIYKVADATSQDSNLAFVYPDSLNSCQKDLDDGNITSEVLDCVISSDVDRMDAISDENGFVEFRDLDLGLYLVTQTNQVEGYSKIEPFLVMIPQIQDNSWIYYVEATPKVDIIRLFDLSVEKVWNVSTKVDTPDSVIIELLRDNEVIDTVTVSSETNWTYTWKQIEKSDKYSVREKEVPEGYTVTYRQEGNHFVVTNTKSLVQTGRSVWITPILAILGLLFVGVGVILEKRKKYE